MIKLTRKWKVAAGLAGVLCFLLIAMQIALSMVDVNALLDPLRERVLKLTSQPLVTESVSVQLLSEPGIHIEQVAIRNVTETLQPYLIYANHVHIAVDREEMLFSDQPRIHSITFSGLDVYLERSSEEVHNWDFIAETKKQVQAMGEITIHLRQARIAYVNRENDFEFQLQDIKGAISLASDKLAADFTAGVAGTPVTFAADCAINEFKHFNQFDSDCQASLEGEGMLISIKNRMRRTLEIMQSRSSITIDAEDLRRWCDAFFSQNEQAMQRYIKEPLGLEASIESYEDLEQSITNITQFTLGNSAGQGSITYHRENQQPVVNVKARFERLDFDSIKQVIGESAGTEDDLFALENGFNARRTGSIEIGAQEVLYNGLSLQAVTMKGAFGAGEIAVDEVRGKLPGEGGFVTLGRIAATANGVQYDGVVEASGQQLWQILPLVDITPSAQTEAIFTDYRARLNVNISPVSSIISEMRVIAGDNIRIAGGMNLRNTAENPSTATLTIENLDLRPFEAAYFQDTSLFESPAEIGDESPYAFRWLLDYPRNLGAQLRLSNFRLREFSGREALIKFNLSQGELNLSQINLNLDNTQVRGSVSITRDDKMDRPFILSNLNISQLDLGDALMDVLWEQEGAPAVPGDKSVWNKQSFNFHPLRHSDGRHELRIRRLLHEKFSASGVRGVAILDNGKLELKEWRMSIWQGVMTLDAELDVRTLPNFKAEFQTQNTILKSMLGSWVDFTNINGLVSLNGNMNTNGVDFSSWIRNLTGAVTFDARNVITRYFNLPAIVRAINSIRSISGLSNAIRLAFASGSTRFNSVEGTMYFKDGLLDTTRISMRSNESVGQLDGYIDLRQWQTNINVRLGLISLAQSNYPFLVISFIGPTEMPDRQLNLKSIEAFLAQKLR